MNSFTDSGISSSEQLQRVAKVEYLLAQIARVKSRLLRFVAGTNLQCSESELSLSSYKESDFSLNSSTDDINYGLHNKKTYNVNDVRHSRHVKKTKKRRGVELKKLHINNSLIDRGTSTPSKKQQKNFRRNLMCIPDDVAEASNENLSNELMSNANVSTNNVVKKDTPLTAVPDVSTPIHKILHSNNKIMFNGSEFAEVKIRNKRITNGHQKRHSFLMDNEVKRSFINEMKKIDEAKRQSWNGFNCNTRFHSRYVSRRLTTNCALGVEQELSFRYCNNNNNHNAAKLKPVSNDKGGCKRDGKKNYVLEYRVIKCNHVSDFIDT